MNFLVEKMYHFILPQFGFPCGDECDGGSDVVAGFFLFLQLSPPENNHIKGNVIF